MSEPKEVLKVQIGGVYIQIVIDNKAVENIKLAVDSLNFLLEKLPINESQKSREVKP